MLSFVVGRLVPLRGLPRVAVCVVTLGCAHAYTTVYDPVTHHHPRTAAEAVRIYDTQSPDCAYDEIGSLRVEGGELTSWGRIVGTARQKAHEMGGDAIINFREDTRPTGAVVTAGRVSTVDVNEASSLHGTVIRFRDGACMR